MQHAVGKPSKATGPQRERTVRREIEVHASIKVPEELCPLKAVKGEPRSNITEVDHSFVPGPDHVEMDVEARLDYAHRRTHEEIISFVFALGGVRRCYKQISRRSLLMPK
jgi:hypothetical protein